MLFQALVVDKRNSDAANVPDLTIGTHDAFCGIEGRSFRQGSLDQVRHGLPILWMNTIEVFLNARRFAGRIERARSEEHTSELQSPDHLVCRLLLEKKKKIRAAISTGEKYLIASGVCASFVVYWGITLGTR